MRSMLRGGQARTMHELKGKGQPIPGIAQDLESSVAQCASACEQNRPKTARCAESPAIRSLCGSCRQRRRRACAMGQGAIMMSTCPEPGLDQLAEDGGASEGA